MAISVQEFIRFKRFLQDQCGIILEENKKYLVESRLKKLLEENNISNMNKLMEDMAGPLGKRLRDKVIDAMTTNETSWFRDSKPFDFLKNTVLKSLRETHSRIRIGSFACSSGQEAYSIGICVHEFRRLFPGSFHDGVQIVGLDISQEMLAKAMSGVYTISDVSQGLSIERKKIYFHKDDDKYHIIDDVKNMVSFQQLNLLNSFLLLGKFDIIFCRNVLFYFEPKTRVDIITKFNNSLKDGGYLILGGSESLGQYNIDDTKFETVNHENGQYYKKHD